MQADALHPSGAIMNLPHLVLARMYEHIEPIDRGDRYEVPLQTTLEKMALAASPAEARSSTS
jgi:hypothetical protein